MPIAGASEKIPGVFYDKGGLHANLMHPDFGVVGDGTADDTAAVNAAIADLGVGATIDVPPLNYRFTDTITLLDHQTLRGVGYFLGAGGSPKAQFKWPALSGSKAGIVGGVNNTVKNMLLRGPGVAGTCAGFRSSSSNPMFRNVQCYAWYIGADLTSSFYSQFWNCEFSYCRYGNKLTSCNNIQHFGSKFNGSSAIQYITAVWAANTILHLSMIKGSVEGYDANGAFITSGGLINIDGMYWEAPDPGANAFGIVNTAASTALNLHNNIVYLDNTNRWCDMGSLANSTLNASGNKFKATTSTAVAYSGLGAATSEAYIRGDDWRLAAASGAVYAPALNAGPVANVHVEPPLGLSAFFTDHSFKGRAPVYVKRTAAPTTPIAGSHWWADRATWNPLGRVGTDPYPVFYDGARYRAMGDPTQVSADRGDANVTLTVNTDAMIQRFATTLTANRTVTLSTTGAKNGDRFRVVRTGLGAFTLAVGALKTIPSATAAYVEVAYDSATAAWVLVGYGAL
jgi:hypothetical protein